LSRFHFINAVIVKVLKEFISRLISMRKLTRDFHLFELEYDIGIQIESR